MKTITTTQKQSQSLNEETKMMKITKICLYAALLAAIGMEGCSNNPAKPEQPKPTLYSITINNNATCTNTQNIRVKLNYKNANSAKLFGDITSPTGSVTIPPDSTIDAILNNGEGNKRVGAIAENSSGTSDTAYDDITFDNTPPQGLSSALRDITTKNNGVYFNLNLSDVDTGSYRLSGATSGQGNISTLDSIVLNEGITTIQVYARDQAGNDTTYNIQITASKIRDKAEGLDTTTKAFNSLGYTATDSTEQIGIPTRDGNTIYLRTDKYVKKNGDDHIFVIYDAANSIDSAAFDAINYYNQTMKSASIPRRIIYISPSFNNEIRDKVKTEIRAYEG